MPEAKAEKNSDADNLCAPLNIVADRLNLVKQLIDRQIIEDRPGLVPVLDHLRNIHGKMLRPALVLLSADLFDPPSPPSANDQTKSPCIEIAAIVEMIHTATLMHDDVIDRAQSRRSKKTANELFGNSLAVLLGDYLLSKTFIMCANLDSRPAASVLAGTALEICKAEIAQNLQKNNITLTESEYFEIITGKTASFFTACCSITAIMNNADPEKIDALKKFGKAFGIAFQIRDDLLDITGSPNKTGKDPGSDIDNFKLTLPVIHFLNTDSDNKDLLAEYIQNGRTEKVRQMLKTSGAVDYAAQKANQFVKQAIDSLALFEDSKAKKALIDIAVFSGKRTA